MSSRAFPAPTSALLLTAVLLTGCGMGVAGHNGVTGAAVSGHIIGGQNPVVGASIQMYEVMNNGYGAQAHALLTPAVMSVDGGSFNVSGLYSCTHSTDQVYIVATGGDPGLGTGANGAIGLMAALGECSTLPAIPNIIVNEVTTVAAVWSLAPFMTSYDHVGTSTGNTGGLANAFGMAQNLASFVRGTSPGDTPTGAVVPTEEINSLGNSLAACVNSAGGDGPCATLFTAATPPGGTAPTNTIDAALDIALHPGNNVGDIYNAGTGIGAPFQTSLSAAPNDWTVAVNFPLGAAARQTGGIAFDATGNLWVVATDALYELSPTGTVLNTFNSMAGNTVAIDATGNIWVGAANQTLLEMPSTLGAPTSHVVTLDGGTNIQSLALDGNGNVWYSCSTCSSVYKFIPGTATNTGYPATNVTQASSVSIDPSENVWLGTFDVTSQVTVFDNSGNPAGGTQLGCGTCGESAAVTNDHSGNGWIVGRNLTKLPLGGDPTNINNGGLFSPSAVAIDGAGNAWVTNTESTVLVQGTSSPEQGGLSEFTNEGAAVTGDTAYVSDSLASPQSVAVDGSGGVWLRNSGSTTVTAFVGAGVPVVTPRALGVQNGTLGTEPQ